jgi:hypothetical protein
MEVDMKTRFAHGMVVMLTCCLALVQAATEEEMMAEMEKCAVCKHLAAKPELMKDMTWETHKIDNGMLCVSTVPKEQKSAFEALNKKMQSAIEEVKAAAQQGKPVEICEFCAGWGELMKAGAKSKQIQLTNGMIDMITSDDPAVVAKIHAEADKAIAIQKEMATQSKTAAL